MKKIFKTLLRPIVRRLKPAPVPESKPDPSEYSTLTNPMEVPVQREAYYLALNRYVEEGDQVLDVGMGIGYGLTILAIKAKEVIGVDVDEKSVAYCRDYLLGRNPKLTGVHHYDGYHLPFPDKSFDVITSVDVLEHVERYEDFLRELTRVARKYILVSTPNRRPENTNPDGTPKNYWHLREWSPDELRAILTRCGFTYDFYHLSGPPDGPYRPLKTYNPKVQALTPVIRLDRPAKRG